MSNRSSARTNPNFNKVIGKNINNLLKLTLKCLKRIQFIKANFHLAINCLEKIHSTQSPSLPSTPAQLDLFPLLKNNKNRLAKLQISNKIPKFPLYQTIIEVDKPGLCSINNKKLLFLKELTPILSQYSSQRTC